MKFKFSFILVLAAVSLMSRANNAPQMNAIAEWSGPFTDTVITKYADYSDGVACYVYAPKNIGSTTNCSGGSCVNHFKGDIGTISCVKVVVSKNKKE